MSTRALRKWTSRRQIVACAAVVGAASAGATIAGLGNPVAAQGSQAVEEDLPPALVDGDNLWPVGDANGNPLRTANGDIILVETIEAAELYDTPEGGDTYTTTDPVDGHEILVTVDEDELTYANNINALEAAGLVTVVADDDPILQRYCEDGSDCFAGE